MNNKSYSISWTQPYSMSYSYVSNTEINALQDLIIEEILESGYFEEANAELARIMAL